MFSFLFSYLTGLVAALNPCTVPIYPLVFSYYLKRRDHVSWRNVSLFVAGFILSFLILAGIFLWIGTTAIQELVRFVAAGVIALLGISFLLRGFSGQWLENKVAKVENPFVFGAVFGLALNPCALPLFLVNITVTSLNAFNVANLLLFGLGVATPPLLAAVFGTALIRRAGGRIKGLYTYMNQIVGFFLLAAAALLIWYVAAAPHIAVIASVFILAFFTLLVIPLWRQARNRSAVYMLSVFLFLLWGAITFGCYKFSYSTQFACGATCPPCQACVAVLLAVLLVGFLGFYYLGKE